MAKISKFESVSAERKHLQSIGEMPVWFTTQGYSMFLKNYQYKGETVRGAFRRVASTLAKHDLRPEAEERYFDLLWSGKLAMATPVFCNTGTDRGMPVSCAGSYVGDSVLDFYEGQTEVAMLAKNGFGTASYLGDIRARGSDISTSHNKADGLVPVFDNFVNTKTKVAAAGRRGEWAGYVDFSHGDFWELQGYVLKNPASAHVGWVFEKEDYEKLLARDPEYMARWNELLYMRARTGKGYMWKNWIANDLAPQAIKNSGIRIRSSQLCTEIALPSDDMHTFTCILSSLNLARWDEISAEDIKWAVRFLDSVCAEFLAKAKGLPYDTLHKAIRFTEKARALGLGTLGFHTYLQMNDVAFESGAAHIMNNSIYSQIKRAAEEASRELADEHGEPEWCKGTGMRNATLITIAPNMSSALLAGGVSQGVEPLVCNSFIQQSNAGDFVRSNPVLAKVLSDRLSDKEIKDLMENIATYHNGSVQHLDILTDHEKMVFKTAYEIDQHAIIRLASARQRHIDQAQSINLFFAADEKESVVASVHKAFMDDPRLKSLYYLRSERGVKASTGESTCLACEG
ncbi:ribonucleoside-diphosphate reductase large subunit [Aeromonas phage B614]|nr:ribonucleoside-diphosphate reductase large subunit [Aeromonas phage B614]UYD58213.1 ribonucleoside-diphosphate reductase large subunit [Aeromonas phage UP87]UYD58576.1 ribonucleoside-diphosphate reductase large subunit [Aeromonas phage avDM14-QBC]UYD58790.1 ribonucleoside-diphosphate reductase large subunit [Aeromonas phage avDM10-HWA]UYD58906.1 ribonucleoside-diphosphate reductase large subunit [Aeromonas phage avDM7-IJDJ]UYD59965.1 ribonucleoside-diphosphate reductase large subunit [Aerom